MARIHSRNARLYAGIASAGVPEPITGISKFDLNFTVDFPEVTAFGDANKQYVAGLPDAQGTFSGFYDDATAQLFTAAQDGIARSFYFYPSTSKLTQYFYGAGLFDFSTSFDVGAGAAVSGNFRASGNITKLG